MVCGWGVIVPLCYFDIETSGRDVPHLYTEGKYDEILKYIEEEARATILVFREVYQHLKSLKLTPTNEA